jgi:hypothetical protein
LSQNQAEVTSSLFQTVFDQNYEILDYDEFDNEPNELYKMKKQSIIIKKR